MMTQDSLTPPTKRPLKKQSADIERHIGNKLRDQRRFLSLRQHDLAQALNITIQQLSKYEKGIDRIPASRLYQLSKILSVSVLYFYEGLDGGSEQLNQQEALANLKGKKITQKLLDLQAIIDEIKFMQI